MFINHGFCVFISITQLKFSEEIKTEKLKLKLKTYMHSTMQKKLNFRIKIQLQQILGSGISCSQLQMYLHSICLQESEMVSFLSR